MNRSDLVDEVTARVHKIMQGVAEHKSVPHLKELVVDGLRLRLDEGVVWVECLSDGDVGGPPNIFRVVFTDHPAFFRLDYQTMCSKVIPRLRKLMLLEDMSTV